MRWRTSALDIKYLMDCGGDELLQRKIHNSLSQFKITHNTYISYAKRVPRIGKATCRTNYVKPTIFFILACSESRKYISDFLLEYTTMGAPQQQHSA